MSFQPSNNQSISQGNDDVIDFVDFCSQEINSERSAQQFQRSQNPNIYTSEDINRYQGQEKLRIIHKLSSLRIEINLSTIFSILSNKTLGIFQYGFSAIKRYDFNDKTIIKTDKAISNSKFNPAAAVTKNDQLMLMVVTSLCVQKIDNFLKEKQLKIMGHAFSQISLLEHPYLIQRTRSIQKSESIVNPYRGSTRFEHFSQKNQSEIGLSQVGFDSNENTIKENKFLKKKKQKLISKRENFIDMMDQLIKSHEAYQRNN